MFDRSKFLRNVEQLRKQKGFSIREVEKKIGVSSGYFSRFRGNEKESVPKIDNVSNLADLFQISIDSLLYSDFTSGTCNVVKLEELVRKIIEDTKHGKVYWIKETGDKVYTKVEFFDEPIFSYDEEDENWQSTIFYSDHPLKKTERFGDCYKGRYADGREFMLMSIVDGENENWYLHMIITKRWTEEEWHEEFGTIYHKRMEKNNRTLYSTFDAAAVPLWGITGELVLCIEKSMKDVRVDLDTLAEIDEFLKS